MPTATCLFCKMVRQEIPVEFVYQDPHCIVIRDKYPKAHTHLLIIPRLHVENLDAVTEDHASLLGHLLIQVKEIAKLVGLTEGYRIIVNTGPGGGQEIFHLHVHVLGGRGGRLPGFA